MAEPVKVPPGGELWKIGNEHWVVYYVPGSNPPVPMGWRVSAGLSFVTDASGDELTVARTIRSRSEAYGLGMLNMGIDKELFEFQQDPFATFVQDYEEQAQANPMLQDEEVMALYAGAILENRTPTPEELTQTDFWQSRSDQEREWLTLLTQDPETAKHRRADYQRAVRTALREAGVSDAPEALVNAIADPWVQGRWTESHALEQIRGVADPYSGVRLTDGVVNAARGYDPTSGDATALAGGEASIRQRVEQMFENRPIEPQEGQIDRVVQDVLDGRSIDDVRRSLDMAAGTHPVTGSDITRAGEDDVRAMLADWLGPALAAQYDDQWVRRWAGQLRNDPDAETRFTEELQRLRLAAFPEWDNENIRYSDIAPTAKQLFSQVWQEDPGETDPLFLDILRSVGPGGAGLNEAAARLRREGLTRNIAGVTQQASSGILQATGGAVRQSVL